MFTGIVQAKGHISGRRQHGGDLRFEIVCPDLDTSDTSVGDSIAVNGVCLTVTSIANSCFATDVSAETLGCTTLGTMAEGAAVNLEKAMRISDRLGGHLVSGHVDGVGRITAITEDARSWRYEIEYPAELTRYICRKGSICVDGVSLTVNSATATVCDVNIIPHTYDATIFSGYQIGTAVNLEVDMLARYLERLYKESSGG